MYLLMELCTDGHVFDMLRKHRRIKEPEVKEIVRDICIGLEYIHSERIIHRDIKPENVIMQYVSYLLFRESPNYAILDGQFSEVKG